MSDPIRIAVAEDHRVVAEALAQLLSFDPEVEVVASVGSGDEIISVYAEHRPDLVLMDVTLDGRNGIEATAAIIEQDPDARVLVLTMHDDEDTVAAAMDAGARGYVPKNVEHADLQQAIRALLRGEAYLHPSVTRSFLDRVGRSSGPGNDRLTPQEQRILQRLTDGETTKEIAGALHISVETVKTHLSRIYRKLDAEDRVQAVATALRSGLVK